MACGKDWMEARCSVSKVHAFNYLTILPVPEQVSISVPQYALVKKSIKTVIVKYF